MVLNRYLQTLITERIQLANTCPSRERLDSVAGSDYIELIESRTNEAIEEFTGCPSFSVVRKKSAESQLSQERETVSIWVKYWAPHFGVKKAPLSTTSKDHPRHVPEHI
ncbi:hypothetical protein C8J57DRAFT_1255088 [Mycena rebaudengoi]|nr:hypothetical protein C8J57DRAFT_1255088 [Mycena rebaudengoi]